MSLECHIQPGIKRAKHLLYQHIVVAEDSEKMLSLFTIVFIAFAQITVCLAQSRFAPAYYPAQPYLYATQPQ